LTSFGGAERVLAQLHTLYPDAPIYASVFDRSRLPPQTASWDLRGTGLQRLPGVSHYSRALLPLMPAAFARLDLRGYDVVITASSAFSKNVRPDAGAPNLCYCHTPPRYLWDLRDSYTPGLSGRLASPLIRWLRARDSAAAARVTRFIANSRNVAERIRRNYNRDSTVIYPPVEVERISPNGLPADDFYLVVSRLVGYKRVDLAVQACNRLGRRLIVVGTGPEAARLRSLAGPTVQFAGALPDAEIAGLYARCKAFLFPGLEDFGIAPVEAQAAGRPVVAFAQGGARETVLDGATGLLFTEQTVDSLADAMLRLDAAPMAPLACRTNAERFSAEKFRTQMAAAVTGAYSSGSTL
jgi:glycosyltransferase involved in cell wall biosynthesis